MPTEPLSTGFRAADLGAALFCSLIGLVLAVAPHLATLASSGSTLYFGDGDDVFYTVLSRPAFRGESGLRDPFLPSRSFRPTLYAPLPLVPMARLTRALGLDRLMIPLGWRVTGGFLLGLSLFTIFRVLLASNRRPTAWALGCTLVALGDAGLVGGQTLYGGVGLIRAMLQGTTPMHVPNALGQFRVVTPVLTLPPLIFLGALLIPRLRPGSRTFIERIAGMALLGLCVHLYFYFWTAAVVAILLVLSWNVAIKDRAESYYLALILAGGMAVGAPQIIANARTFSDPDFKPILERTNRGRPLPPGDPARMRYVVNLWAYGKLAFGAVFVFGYGSRRLLPVLAFTASGFLLTNSAIVTGLEFENFHWVYVHAPFGEILILAALAMQFDRLNRIAGAVRWLWIIPTLVVALALIWRPYEALRNSESVLYTTTLHDLLPLRPELARLGTNDVLSGRWPAVNVALLLTDSGQLYQYDQTMYSTLTPLAEVQERKALNAWLNGLNLKEYRDEIEHEETPNSPAVLSTRERLFLDLISGESAEILLDRFRPTHLLRPENEGPPVEQRGGPWSLVAKRGGWALWERKARKPADPGAVTYSIPRSPRGEPNDLGDRSFSDPDHELLKFGGGS